MQDQAPAVAAHGIETGPDLNLSILASSALRLHSTLRSPDLQLAIRDGPARSSPIPPGFDVLRP
jgi:hypothetical protein